MVELRRAMAMVAESLSVGTRRQAGAQHFLNLPASASLYWLDVSS